MKQKCFFVVALVIAAAIIIFVVGRPTVDSRTARLDEFCQRARASLFIDAQGLTSGVPARRDRALAHFEGLGGNSSREDIELCAAGVDLSPFDACLARQDTNCLAEFALTARSRISAP